MSCQAVLELCQEDLNDSSDQTDSQSPSAVAESFRSAIGIASQHTIDNRIGQRRSNVENPVAIERLGIEHVEATGVVEAEDELAVGQLIDAKHLDLDHGPQHARHRCTKTSGQRFMKRMHGPHLIFADPLGTLEIVRGDTRARAP